MHNKIPYGELGRHAVRIKSELQKRIRGDLNVFYIEDTLYVRIFYSSTAWPFDCSEDEFQETYYSYLDNLIWGIVRNYMKFIKNTYFTEHAFEFHDIIKS